MLEFHGLVGFGFEEIEVARDRVIDDLIELFAVHQFEEVFVALEIEGRDGGCGEFLGIRFDANEESGGDVCQGVWSAGFADLFFEAVFAHVRRDDSGSGSNGADIFEEVFAIGIIAVVVNDDVRFGVGGLKVFAPGRSDIDENDDLVFFGSKKLHFPHRESEKIDHGAVLGVGDGSPIKDICALDIRVEVAAEIRDRKGRTHGIGIGVVLCEDRNLTLQREIFDNLAKFLRWGGHALALVLCSWIGMVWFRLVSYGRAFVRVGRYKAMPRKSW